MNRSKSKRKVSDSEYLTITADRFFEFKDRPRKQAVQVAQNGKAKPGDARQRLAKSDRLRPLVAMIGNCMTLARHIDGKGLENVLESLHEAYSKLITYQNVRH
jgi:hypothetical protein